MYHIRRVRLNGEIANLTLEFKASNLDLFYAVENGTPVFITLTNRDGDFYTLSKTSGEPFAPRGFAAFYAISSTFQTNTTIPRSLIEFSLAYKIYEALFKNANAFKLNSFIDPLQRVLGNNEAVFVEGVDIITNDKTRFLSRLVGRAETDNLPPDLFTVSAPARGSIIFSKDLTLGDKIMLLQEDENSQVIRSRVIDNIIYYPNVGIIPNIELSFIPTKLLRCDSKAFTVGNLQIPLSTEEELTYYIEEKTDIVNNLTDLSTNEKFALQTLADVELTESIPALTAFKLSKLSLTDRSITINYGISGGASQTMVTRTMQLPRLTLTLPSAPAKLFIDITFPAEVNANVTNQFPQQLFTSGIEQTNTSWVKTTSSSTNIEFETLYDLTGTGTIEIGWREA